MAQNKKKVLMSEDGTVSYRRSVLNSIISLATKEINGVASLSPSGFSRFKLWFSNNYHYGLKITYAEENRVVVDVYINVLFGYSVNDVAYRVQENIKSSVESMTEFKVDEINVHALGVVFENNDENPLVI
ncbi:MAG: Asp23/Gls24 family envelope stress response protein [Clostridia bacterium]